MCRENELIWMSKYTKLMWIKCRVVLLNGKRHCYVIIPMFNSLTQSLNQTSKYAIQT